jgi:hypothetical protein
MPSRRLESRYRRELKHKSERLLLCVIMNKCHRHGIASPKPIVKDIVYRKAYRMQVSVEEEEERSSCKVCRRGEQIQSMAYSLGFGLEGQNIVIAESDVS